ncbi:hypothetical protein KAU55_04555 [Candidatus Bathyarchaeota archaeon]|nr:hypothetical protein [Candidatus Bathyarchaeota archaeon]
MSHQDIRIEKIGITDIYKVKYSARSWYITIPKKIVRQYGLNSGHFLKVQIKEVRKPPIEEAE